jgi:hypothetical protein
LPPSPLAGDPLRKGGRHNRGRDRSSWGGRCLDTVVMITMPTNRLFRAPFLAITPSVAVMAPRASPPTPRHAVPPPPPPSLPLFGSVPCPLAAAGVRSGAGQDRLSRLLPPPPPPSICKGTQRSLPRRRAAHGRRTICVGGGRHKPGCEKDPNIPWSCLPPTRSSQSGKLAIGHALGLQIRRGGPGPLHLTG